MKNDLKIEILLPATPKQVMQMLTDQQQIEIWSGEAAVFEAREGGKVSLFDGWMNGVVEKISADEISYTWISGDWEEGTKPSLVHFKLKQDGEQTAVVLEHSGLPDEDEVKSHKTGWIDLFFTPLEDYLMVRFNKD
jgi:uncharacterized protein YndB with AHSA1/START domain